MSLYLINGGYFIANSLQKISVISTLDSAVDSNKVKLPNHKLRITEYKQSDFTCHVASVLKCVHEVYLYSFEDSLKTPCKSTSCLSIRYSSPILH